MNLIKKTLSLYFVYYLVFFTVSGLFYFLLAPQLNITEKTIYISPVALVLESLAIFIVSLILLTVTRRKNLALLISLLLYIAFISINIIKIRYLATPLYPIDFMQVGDLFKTWELFKVFLPAILLIVLIFIIILKYGYKKEQVCANNFILLNFLILILFIGYIATVKENIETGLRNFGIYHKKNANLPRRGLKYGYLTNFVQSAIFIKDIEKPSQYGISEIKRIVDKYHLNLFSQPKIKYSKPDNIIILLVEAFTDPEDFGWQFTKEPIPFFKKTEEHFSSGFIYSPVYGGKSINAEFELMTGLSNRFTPIESMPYQEYIDINIPSLPRTLGEDGYTSNTIQVIKFKGFGYGKIYDYLGVNNKISLANKKLFQQDPTGKFTSSVEIANEIFTISRNQKASFIFAFPNSSHSPWYIENYPDSQILLTNENQDQALQQEVSAYANAIHHTDDLFKLLIQHFTGSDEKTVIIMLGDHQPSIQGYHRNIESIEEHSDYVNMILKKYLVPVAVWTNYAEIKHSEIYMSMNFLSSYILELVGLKLKGFMKFNDIVRKKIQVLTHIVQNKDGELSQDVPADFIELVNDYEMLQYDILFGEYYLKDIVD